VRPTPAAIRTVWLLTIFLSAIGVATVARRAVQLVAPSKPPGLPAAAALDAGFTRHSSLTMVHIIPGLLFVVLGPPQFVRGLRARRPKLHRWTGRLLLASGMTIGITALVMSPQMAIGGVNETAATMLFALLFLYSLGRAFVAIRRREIAVHREWMIRGFAIGLAVAFVRPIAGLFFATSRISHLTPREFFGTAFWLGFTIQTMAAEVWINYTRACNSSR
jgi:uncharacterized membrane protein